MTIGNQYQLTAIKINGKKLKSALEFLRHKKITQHTIVKKVNEKLATQGQNSKEEKLNESMLSKLKKAHYEAKYKSINSAWYEKIFDIIIPMIKEKGGEWDELKQKFIIKGLTQNQQKEIKKLNGLNGIWIGYSWNKSDSETEQKDLINKFKIKIENHTKIIGQTQRATFPSGVMKILNNDRIVFELNNQHRSLILLANIGVNQQLENLNEINIAYVDSGDKFVKCGLAVLKRSDEDYEIIKTDSIELNALKLIYQSIQFDQLRNTQLFSLDSHP